ncbi:MULTISPECIES: hypothetical protein [Planktothricoides]|uniref:Uncharacterized protein n=2 Tax=Planktothricoides raciborskii TaxID=132608 RepID=A0AAU8JGX0_9CYAN|nr:MULTISPECIES: hypothetical protein [Planktothricoides]MBD2545637.1 hypothetical protein [Planktothricoides raciborskii FACHB-1370]MBD2585253.1 hypothetical protein [Planktothricoides raciborskii FACHB-1261]
MTVQYFSWGCLLGTKKAAIKAKVPPIKPFAQRAGWHYNSHRGKFFPLRLANNPAAVPTAQ